MVLFHVQQRRIIIYIKQLSPIKSSLYPMPALQINLNRVKQYLNLIISFDSIIYTLCINQVLDMSKKTKMTQIPLFINKIYEMIQKKNNSDVIDWTSTHDSFSIKNISKFTEEVLPFYFKHKNFASFIRQLNMYGFKKIRHSQGQNVYMNENFKGGAKHLLKNINRKIKEEKEEQVQVYRGSSPGRGELTVSRQIQELKSNQRNLQQMCKYFMNQNQRLLEENQNIIKRMEQDQKDKEQKLQQLLVYLLTQKNTSSLLNSSKKQAQLSIANEQYQSDDNYLGFKKEEEISNVSPLEKIDNAIMANQQMSKLKSLVQGIYSKKQGKKQKRKDPNQQELINSISEDCKEFIEPIQQPNGTLKMADNIEIDKQSEQDDRSFLSINDFLNADNFANAPYNLFQP